MKHFSIFALTILLLFSACHKSNNYSEIDEKYHPLLDIAIANAGKNSDEIISALSQISKEKKNGMAFLISYMPKHDLRNLSADFLIENVDQAYLTKEKYFWAKELPDSIFLNEVLPYASMNETRDNWRADFNNRFDKYVKDCATLGDAIDSVNRNICAELEVEYNTAREKPDQSPYESMRQKMASCSGLSILLTDAFRSVGIPSRIAGTPNWHDDRGNHNWCEVWINGKWYFTEYYPSELNSSWFLKDAGQADPNDSIHAIYASSFKPTETAFPLVWDSLIDYVHAYNVSDRYINIYKKHLKKMEIENSAVPVKVEMICKNSPSKKDKRIATNIDVFCDGEQICGGRTAGQKNDLNDVLTFNLKKNRIYSFKYFLSNNKLKEVEVEVKEEPINLTLEYK